MCEPNRQQQMYASRQKSTIKARLLKVEKTHDLPDFRWTIIK